MTSTTSPAPAAPLALLEKVVLGGDLSKLTPADRLDYYHRVCQSLGLNPLTRPFQYLELDGKLILYAGRDCTDQLRESRHVSTTIISRERLDDVYIVTARATLPDGRADESAGVVSLVKEDGEWQTSQSGKRFFRGNGQWKPLRGDALANALMRAETKSKRRVTLSIVGLGMIDETEIETIPTARPVQVDPATGEILPSAGLLTGAELLARLQESTTGKALTSASAAALTSRPPGDHDEISPSAAEAYAKAAVEDKTIGVPWLRVFCQNNQVTRVVDLPDNKKVELIREILRVRHALAAGAPNTPVPASPTTTP